MELRPVAPAAPVKRAPIPAIPVPTAFIIVAHPDGPVNNNFIPVTILVPNVVKNVEMELPIMPSPPVVSVVALAIAVGIASVKIPVNDLIAFPAAAAPSVPPISVLAPVFTAPTTLPAKPPNAGAIVSAFPAADANAFAS